MTVQNPHDKFFRETFARIEIARDFLREYLPPDVAADLQLDTLELQSDSFVDEDLRAHQTDMLYQTQLADGSEAYVYLLFEHKSYPDPGVALQLLRYMVRIWTRQREDGEVLRPIIPILIYHGERRWQISADFQSLIPHLPDSLRPYVPQFNYQLRDFSYRSELELRGDVWLMTVLLVLRAILSPTINNQLPQLIAVMMRLLEKRNGVDFVYTILYYLSVGTDKVSRTDLRKALDDYVPQGEKLMATLAQQWIEEGRIEGEIKGENKKARAIAYRLISMMDDEQICAITDLSLAEVKQIRQTQFQSK